MVKTTKKTVTQTKKTRGRQSDFSGEKQEYLDSLAKEFRTCKDRGAFYDEAAQGLIDKFGYSRDGKLFVEADTLTEDEQLEYYKGLRSKLGQWFRHRCLAKSSDHTYVEEIVNSIKSAASQQPRKRSALTMYMEQNKERFTREFAVHWSAVQNNVSQKKRLSMYYEFVKTCWKNETQSYRDEIEKNAQEEHDVANREWKEKIESFKGTPEGFKRAWGMAESVLPSFADGFAEWLGAQVIIVAVSPNPSNGEITMQSCVCFFLTRESWMTDLYGHSVQSDCSKGHTKTLLPQFDVNGWKKVQEMIISYGKAFFSPEECKRRIVKMDDDDPEAELTVEDTTLGETETGVNGEVLVGGGGIKEKDAEDAPVDTEPEPRIVEEPQTTIVAESETVTSIMDVSDDQAYDRDDPPTTVTIQTTAQNNRANGCSPNHMPTPTSCANSESPKTIASGANPPLAIPNPSLHLSPPSASPEMNGNPFAFQQAAPPGFQFPEESRLSGTHVQAVQGSSTFDPYSCDFSFMTDTWSTVPTNSATPFLNPSTGFWFGNGENDPSGLTLPQESKIYPQGGFLRALYEPLDPSLDPSNSYPIPGPLNIHINQPILGFQSQSLGLPIIQPPVIQPPVIQPPVIQPPVIQPEGNVTVQEPAKGSDERFNVMSVSQGEKRKGDETVAKPAKKMKGTENVNTAEKPTQTIAGKEVEEGTVTSSEGKERAGKPTLSGRVPLMPTHLAEAGYKGEKKGVRGKKAEPTKKPRSKGYSAKRASKGAAKTPANKNIK